MKQIKTLLIGLFTLLTINSFGVNDTIVFNGTDVNLGGYKDTIIVHDTILNLVCLFNSTHFVFALNVGTSHPYSSNQVLTFHYPIDTSTTISFIDANTYTGELVCFKFDTTHTITHTGISEFSKSNINVYPNPTTDKIFIGSKDNEKYKVDITNMLSQTIYSTTVESNSPIDLTSFSKGYYLVFVKDLSGNVINFKKLIVN